MPLGHIVNLNSQQWLTRFLQKFATSPTVLTVCHFNKILNRVPLLLMYSKSARPPPDGLLERNWYKENSFA